MAAGEFLNRARREEARRRLIRLPSSTSRDRRRRVFILSRARLEATGLLPPSSTQEIVSALSPSDLTERSNTGRREVLYENKFPIAFNGLIVAN
uniref:Uncharacterized protein n=1 Tax=Leersia perrieri TaxID=77586 RepID=A0A0D9VGK2_9ORYZ